MSEASQFIAGRLRILRSQASLSQEQAADLVGITFKYYQRLESGAVLGLRLSSVEKITKAYGIDLETFFSSGNRRLGSSRWDPHPIANRKVGFSGHLATLRTFHSDYWNGVNTPYKISVICG